MGFAAYQSVPFQQCQQPLEYHPEMMMKIHFNHFSSWHISVSISDIASTNIK